MTLVTADRVYETTTTTGTGALALAAAISGHRRFSSVCSTSDTCYYSIFAVDGNGNPSGDWETGLGTYSSANTLTRTTVQASSNSNNAVNFGAGTKYVMLTPTAAQLGTFKLSAPTVQAVTSSATVTPTFSDDLLKITSQAAGLTLANWSGTSVPGWSMAIRIKDNGTARSITYGSNYRAIGVTLPSTTIISKTLYLGCIWNADDSKIDVVAVAQEA